MKSHIVLCEGRHDAHFAKSVIEGCDDRNRKIQKVNAEDFDGQDVPYQEQSSIFSEVYWGNESYVKSEGAANSLYEAAGKACRCVFGDRPFSLTVVADLDQRPLEALVNRIDDEFHDNSSGSVEWTDWSREAATDDEELETWTATLRDDRDRRESFYLVTFENDLEATVGITDTDSKSEWQSKVNRYASRREVREAFVDLYC